MNRRAPIQFNVTVGPPGFGDRRKRIRNRVIATVLTCLGLILILAGIGKFLQTAALHERGVHTTGTVVAVKVEVEEDSLGDPVREEKQQVAFTATDGTRHTFWIVTGPEKGGTVDVFYDPRDPEEAVIGSTATLWVGGVIYLFFGFALMSVPVLYLLIRRGVARM